MSKSYLVVKRILDFTIALIGVILLSPLFLVIAIIIKIDSRGPIFFTQKRVKKNKKLFNIIKFRSMHVNTPAETPTHMLSGTNRWITRVGKILRKTSLDELPQIFNVLSGDMSIIGPRPALWNQNDLIEERDKYGANEVPVGISGWAQINGRDELPISIKAKLDGEYASNISFVMDVKCFLGTISSVFRASGIVEGQDTNQTTKD